MRLQIYPLTDYFLVMRNIGRGRRKAGIPSGRGALVAALIVVLGTGCDERERLTFETPNDNVGPVTSIDQPNGADTTVSQNAEFFVTGASVDPDGVDTVYFLVIGGSHNFSPFSPKPTQTTVRFGIPLAISGHFGETFEVQVYAVDIFGNRGRTSTRLIHIQ
jgi:hypothetical protein